MRIHLKRIFLTIASSMMLCLFLEATVFSALREQRVSKREDNRNKKRNSSADFPQALPKPINDSPNENIIKGNSRKFSHSRNPWFPLYGDLKYPKPALKIGNFNGKADIMIGIPTVKRSKGDYLVDTLRSVLDNHDNRRGVLVKTVVFIAETDQEYLNERKLQLGALFKESLKLGDLEIISPPSEFYPQWNISLVEGFNDNIERRKWRSKENLDQVFLMMYVYQHFPKYYLMLEDDVSTAKDYGKIILKEADSRTGDWFLLSFCELGTIGKLFRTSTLPPFASFIDMFWNRKPLDWLQSDYARVSYCGYDGKEKECQSRIRENTPLIKPSLFQHMGLHSSLEGKVQKLKDKSFNAT